MPSPAPLAVVDGQPITILDRDDCLRRVGSRLDAGQGFTLYTLNLDHLVKRRQSAIFRELYMRATFVTADGWPIVALARRSAPDVALTTGSDLVEPLCKLAAERGVPVFLFGTEEAALRIAASRLAITCLGLEIVGWEAPAQGFAPTSAAARDAAERIAASGARLCFVALGAPKQETFSDFAAALHPEIGLVCIGAGLDFIAGTKMRAPPMLRRFRLEWAWRLAREPGRLGTRYVQCAALLVRLAMRRG